MVGPPKNENNLREPPNRLGDDVRVFELIDHERRCWREERVTKCFYPFEMIQILAVALHAIFACEKICMLWFQSPLGFENHVCARPQDLNDDFRDFVNREPTEANRTYLSTISQEKGSPGMKCALKAR